MDLITLITLLFSLGILAFALIYAVMGVSELKQQVSHLETSANTLSDVMQIKDERTNDRISDQVSDIYRTLDSRLDKLEKRLSK